MNEPNIAESNENLIANDAFVVRRRGEKAVAIVAVLPERLPSGERLDVPSEIDGNLVVEFGSRAFQNCADRKLIAAPYGLKKIADDAFPPAVKIGVPPYSYACLWAKVVGWEFELVLDKDPGDVASRSKDEDDENQDLEDAEDEKGETKSEAEDASRPFPKVSPTHYWFAAPPDDEKSASEFERIMRRVDRLLYRNDKDEESYAKFAWGLGEANAENDFNFDAWIAAELEKSENEPVDELERGDEENVDDANANAPETPKDELGDEEESGFDEKELEAWLANPPETPVEKRRVEFERRVEKEDKESGDDTDDAEEQPSISSDVLQRVCSELEQALSEDFGTSDDGAPIVAYISADKRRLSKNFIENAMLKEYRVSPDNPDYLDIDGVLFSADQTVLIRYPSYKLDEKYVVPAGVREIAKNAFSHSWLCEIVITSDVEIVDGDAFSHCPLLGAIRVEDNPIYSSIDGVLFQYDYKLVRYPEGKMNRVYVVPSEVVEIDDWAFVRNSHLERVIIGESVMGIGWGAFSGCSRLKEFETNPQNANYTAFEGVLFDSSLQRLIAYPPAKMELDYKIPDETESIEEKAFANAVWLRRVYVPAGVREIGDAAFTACRFLVEIQVSPDNASYASFDGALMNRCETELIACPSQPLVGVFVVPDGVQTLEDRAFGYGSKISRIWIGADVMEIDEDAFMPSTGTVAFEVSPENEYFSALDGVLFDKDQTTLVRYPVARPGDYYRVPSTVRTIRSNAFLGASQLKTIVLPEGVESIESEAFCDLANLERVLIPRSVTSISPSAFDDYDVALCVYKDSYAHDWALAHDVPFALIEEDA